VTSRSVARSEQIEVPGESAHVALALVNSLHAGRTGPVDHLATPEQARRWLIQRRALPRDVALTAADLTRIQQLRAAVRRLFEAYLAGGVANRSDLSALNEALAAVRHTTALVWRSGDGPRVEQSTTAPDPLAGALAVVAADAADLVSDQVDLIICEADGCVRMLRRDHGRRRWCSTRCGDRVRAARHYARTRAQAGPA
jgi:predicted RNA-binding Zn ribbon-like protein